MGMWYGNARLRRAYRVVRRRGTDAVVLRNAYGRNFTETLARLEQNGYRALQRKPAYAERGKY